MHTLQSQALLDAKPAVTFCKQAISITATLPLPAQLLKVLKENVVLCEIGISRKQ